MVNDRAAEWVARIDAAPLDAAAQAELDQWLASDDRHRGAFLRASAAWHLCDQATALGGHLRDAAHAGSPAFVTRSVVEAQDAPGDVPEAGRPHALSRRGMLWGGGALAASLLAAAGLGFWKGGGEQVETALGEIRRVPFPDGSMASINTATRLKIDFAADVRMVELDRGEAWFKVAKNKNRPFIVAAGEARVRAVGTAFSVQRLDSGADVQVTEGVVEIWATPRTADRILVKAGERAFIRYDAGPQAPVRDAAGIARKLAWRDGALKFEGTTLQEAAAEFNRYNGMKIEVDPALAQERIVGRFRTDEPDAFARSASAMLDARFEMSDKRILIAKN